MSAYAATKAGMNDLVQSLAAEHASEGIRINSLLPGGTITPAGGEGNDEVLAFDSGLHPIKRTALPKEIAQAALFMLSDRAGFPWLGRRHDCSTPLRPNLANVRFLVRPTRKRTGSNHPDEVKSG